MPAAIRPFLTGTLGNGKQTRAGFEQMGLAIARYTKHRQLTGIGGEVKVAA